MTRSYELAILGSPSESQRDAIEQCLAEAVQLFWLELGKQVSWEVLPARFNPSQRRAAAALFFCARGAPTGNLDELLARGIPILPVVTRAEPVREVVPPSLVRFNCLTYDPATPEQAAAALLECAGLLPRQRRVFVSYRRDEAGGAALQLFDELSARFFDVFLDTHGIAPAADLPLVLLHRLCDSDVLVMLDTPSYFESRWTSAEFGRALAKGISVLRVGWPNFAPSARTATASRVDLTAADIDVASGRIADQAVGRICAHLELVRSQSHAVRNVNLLSNIRHAVERMRGSVAGVGIRNAIYVQLPNHQKLVAFPAVGVPTSTHLRNATPEVILGDAAVVYDAVGSDPAWQSHLDWLGAQFRTAKLVKAHEVARTLAAWGGS